MILDVSLDHLFIESNHGNKVTATSEILTREILGLPGKSSHYRYRTLPFDMANYIQYRVFRRNADVDMRVTQHQMPFHNQTFLLFR